jgi:hypothetical protein
MINLNFTIDNPWSDRWNTIWFKNGLLSKHKAWEFNGYRTHHIVDAECRFTLKGDHAGLIIMLGLVGYSVEFSVYDTRHWDYEKECWKNYDNT